MGAERERQSGWLPLIAIASSMVMMYITSFGVNVLINPIVTDLGTTVATLQSVIVAASLIAGSLMVTAGRLGDKLGKKKVFVSGVAIYTVGLLVVVLSPNTAVFALGWGVIWPSGMVLIIPTSIAMIMYFYSGPQRALAFGIYGAVLSAVSALAPVFIGFLSDQIGWRLALSLSPAFGVITLLLAVALPETDRDSKIRIDIPSVLLSLFGFGMFLVATTLAGRYGWFLEKRPLEIGGQSIGLFGFSVVPFLYALSALLLMFFFRRSGLLKARGDEPLLDGTLLKNVRFTLGMTIGALFFLVNAGMIFAVSVFLQAGVRMDSLQTALTTLPFTAVLAILSFATPGLSRYLAPKWIVVIGSVVMAFGLWLIGRDAAMTMLPSDVLVAMVISGAGAGLIMAQVASITMSTVAPAQEGAASGLSETMKEIIGQGFAVALAGSILFGAVYASMVDSYSELEGISLSQAEHQEIVVELEDTFQGISEAGENEFIAALPEATRQGYRAVVDRAAMSGLTTTLTVLNVVLLITLLLALCLPRISEARNGSTL